MTIPIETSMASVDVALPPERFRWGLFVVGGSMLGQFIFILLLVLLHAAIETYLTVYMDTFVT